MSLFAVRPATRRRPRRRRGRAAPAYRLVGAVVLAAAAGAALITLAVVRQWDAQADGAGGGADGRPAPASPFAATLYYVAADGLGLVAHDTAVPFDAGPLSRARAIAERQLAAPPPPLRSPFPDGTRLRAIYLTDNGHAFVDLSGEVSAGHSGGSLDELLTVYALVNALTLNVPDITAVQILIDGREVDTLAGHIDLRQPLAAGQRWVADPSADPPADPPPDDAADDTLDDTLDAPADAAVRESD